MNRLHRVIVTVAFAASLAFSSGASAFGQLRVANGLSGQGTGSGSSDQTQTSAAVVQAYATMFAGFI